jgi:hypothetical protein
LCKGQAQELFTAGEVTDLIVALVAVDAAREQLAMDQLNELGKNESSSDCHPKVELFSAKLASPTRYPSHLSFVVSTTFEATNKSAPCPKPDTSGKDPMVGGVHDGVTYGLSGLGHSLSEAGGFGTFIEGSASTPNFLQIRF